MSEQRINAQAELEASHARAQTRCASELKHAYTYLEHLQAQASEAWSDVRRTRYGIRSLDIRNLDDTDPASLDEEQVHVLLSPKMAMLDALGCSITSVESVIRYWEIHKRYLSKHFDAEIRKLPEPTEETANE